VVDELIADRRAEAAMAEAGERAWADRARLALGLGVEVRSVR